jgi:cystathionine gamma-synthase
MSNWRPETKAAQALGWVDKESRALSPPIHPASTYERDPDNTYRSGRVYSRDDNPTYDQAEALLTELEGGAGCLLFASGMAAAAAVFQALAPGDRVIVPETMYHGLRRWLQEYAVAWGLQVVSLADLGPEPLAAALRAQHTRLVWVETPANPTWQITDIAAVTRVAHAAGALVAVDNTLPTPVLTQPLALGADIVMHSATKYLNGHGDVVAGALVTARADDLWTRIRGLRHDQGAVLGPFEAWLLLRGMRTLPLRVAAASRAALAIAEHFNGHGAVARVLYPGLADHAGHDIAARQMHGGYGGMLSLRLADEVVAITVAARTRLFKRATSFGGVESLIEHRASVEGAGSPVPPDLLRMSVGIEHIDDLIADLEQALSLT